tara:strand:+ start:4784 stop:5227 length:444 start_codon:yes stop_codon:yes gene_type:complete
MKQSKWKWATAHKTKGSGLVVVREFSDGWKVLGLWARNGYDIPKGHVESGDSTFDTAVREALEEASLTNLSFEWGTSSIRLDNLHVYLASTQQDAVLGYNYEDDMYEHDYVKWLSWGEMHAKSYDYLKPAILWARDVVLGSHSADKL